MGHIIKTPAGNFRANWRDATGRQKAKTFKSRKQAAAFLAETESSLTHGTYVDPHAGRIRFGQLAARWLASRDVAPRTAERTLSLMRTHVLPKWEAWPINRIDYLSVQEWVADLTQALAPATVAKCHAVLVMVLRTAVRAKLLGQNPAEGVKVPRVRPDTPRRAGWLTREDFTFKLLPALPDKHRAIACVAAGAGLRWGECAGLPWGAVDLENRLLRVRQVAVETPGEVILRASTKTRAGIRTVPMPDFLIVALEDHRRSIGTTPQPDMLVFTSREGTALRRSHFRRRVWRPALLRAGLPASLRFHDLRHSYATWLVTDGVPINVVQRVMGHAQASTTLNRYTHTPEDYVDRVRKAFDYGSADDSLTPPGQDGPNDDQDEDGTAGVLVR